MVEAPLLAPQLRDALKRDFNIEVNISGGSGKSRRDPVVVLDKKPSDAALTEIKMLRGLGMGRQVLWRTVLRSPVRDAGPFIEQVRIEAWQFEPTVIHKTLENYYFDLSQCAQTPPLRPPFASVEDPSLSLPLEIGWVHLDNSVMNEPDLGTTVIYDAFGIKMTVYHYDYGLGTIPPNLASPLFLEHFAQVESDVIGAHPSAKPLGEREWSRVFLLRSYIIGNTVSLLGMGTLRGKFFKVRLSYTRDGDVQTCAMETFRALEALLQN